MRYEIEVEYDSQSIIKGAKAYGLRKHRQDVFLSPVFLLVIVVWLIYSGDEGLLAGFLLAIAFGYLLIVYGIVFINPYRSAKIWKRAGLKKAKWTFDDEYIQSTSEIGQIRLKWENVRELWLDGNMWFLIYDSGVHSSLPVADFTEEQKIFVKSKVHSHGGRII